MRNFAVPSLIRPVSQGLQDWFVLDEMKDCLRRHLNAGLLECSAVAARDLGALDADAVMADLRRAFDPESRASPIQDAFADAFFAPYARLKESGCAPLTPRAALPSGAGTGLRTD